MLVLHKFAFICMLKHCCTLQAKRGESDFMREAMTDLRAAVCDDQLADQAEDLLQQMLHVDPTQRCTVQEALSHSLLVHFTKCRQAAVKCALPVS